MAKSTTKPPSKTIPISGATAVEDPPMDAGVTETAPPETTAPPTDQKPVPSKTPTFFQTMNKVPKPDWGPRATIYLYRVEPVIDRTRSGETKFINTYAEPVNEDRIMADYGSGRYKLILNFRKPGAETGDVIDSVYMDILNMKYPPKIPVGEWTDDPRNKKWAWAKEAAGQPAPPQATPTGVETLVDVMRVTGEMRKELREEMKADAPAATATPAPPADPFDTAKKIMEMRANDPMVAALMQRLEAMDRSAEAARAREFDLQKELRQQAAAPAAAQKSWIDQLIELAASTEKLEPVKKFLSGLFGTAEGGTVRAAKMGTLEFFADVLPKIAEAPIMTAIATKMMMAPANGAPAVSLPNLPNPAQPAQPNQEAEFLNFMKYAISPALIEYLESGEPGDEFAAWVNNAYPDKLIQVQKFHHPMIPGLPGPPSIMAAYRNSPLWPRIAARGEAVFNTFVNEFCAWKPEGEASAAPPPASGEPIDLDNELGGNV